MVGIVLARAWKSSCDELTMESVLCLSRHVRDGSVWLEVGEDCSTCRCVLYHLVDMFWIVNCVRMDHDVSDDADFVFGIIG